MRCDFGGVVQEEGDVSLEGQVVLKKDTFRYLGSMLQRDGDIDADVSHRIKAGWIKWQHFMYNLQGFLWLYFSLLKYYTILRELKNNHCYIFLVRKSVAPTTSSFYV